MPAYLNVADVLKILIFSVIFIWGANKILKKVGLNQFTVGA